MDLHEFISATLIQIVKGVAESADEISKLGGAVNPAFGASGKLQQLGHSQDGEPTLVYAVDFDVAVVVSNTTGAEGGGKVQVASFFSLGAKASTEGKEETTSRIKFLVPLRLPTDAKSSAAAKVREENARARRDGPIVLGGGPDGWMAK